MPYYSRCPYYANSDATFQSFRLKLLVAGDVEPNPGTPETAVPTRAVRRAPVTVLSQNVRSLRNKLHTLRSHSTELEKYSVIAITESWLDERTTDSELQFGLENHTWFRRDRAGLGGGVACAVRSDLYPVRRSDLEAVNTEMLIVQLKTVPSLLIAVCYCKPAPDDGTLERTMSALQSAIARNPARRLVAIGDFNVPEVTWEPTHSGRAGPRIERHSRRATEFLDACELCGLTQHVCQPTRGENTLDLVLTTEMEVDVSVREGIFDSDHRELLCSIESVKACVPLVTRTTAFNYKQADFTGLKQALGLIHWSVLANTDIDDATDLFYSLLESAIRDFVPVVTMKRRFPPWFDRELRTALKEKETAFKRMKRNRSEESVGSFHNKRRNFKNLSDQKYNEYLIGLTDELKTNPKRFWSFLKSVKGGKRGPHVLSDGHEEVVDDVERANLLNRTFTAKFTDPGVDVDELPDGPVYDLPPLTALHCDADTVRMILRDVSANKACGPDGISARVVHECAEELAAPLAVLFSSSLSQGTFPKLWKRANVVPIHKKGSVKDPKNYRSISLMSLFGKVLEKFVSEQLLAHVLPAMSESQHGYIPRRSCATNLVTLLKTAWDSFSSGTQTDCIYTDVTAAFLSVNHTLLLHKLRHSYHISGTAHQWFASYLTDRQQRVIVNGKGSSWTPVRSGTPEGGLLSPLLFAMYINDLSDQIKSPCLMFADDVKIYRKINCTVDVVLLQEDLSRLCRWSQI